MLSFWKKYNLHHETKRHALWRFLALAAVLIIYFFWMVWSFGIKSGFEVTLLTWSFFIFCTPIADAGFLVAFPTRLLLGVRMMTSQIWAFFFAFFLDTYFFIFRPEIFTKTMILKIFQKIVENPFPYWGILILSALGTFLSIYFGDELIDTMRHDQRVKYKKHRLKHQFIIGLFLFLATFFLYKMLLQNLGLQIPS